jgi:hypothetical protein
MDVEIEIENFEPQTKDEIICTEESSGLCYNSQMSNEDHMPSYVGVGLGNVRPLQKVSRGVDSNPVALLKASFLRCRLA